MVAPGRGRSGRGEPRRPRGAGSDVGSALRGEVFVVDLNPARGGEIRKVRPAVVVSPDELNRESPTVIVAPLTTGSHAYPFRIPCRLGGTAGHVVLDQVRAVDRERLVRRVGRLPPATMSRALAVLREMFAA